MRPVADALSKANRAILPDQRGTGGSTLRQETAAAYAMKAYVEDLERLRVHLGLERWTLLGSSWGGTLAMAYAAAHPARVEALVLVDSGGATMTMADVVAFQSAVKAKLTPEDQAAVAFWSGPGRALVSPRRATTEAFRAKIPAYLQDRRNAPAFVASIGMEDLNPVPGEVIWEELLDPASDLRPRLKTFPGPVLVVRGKASPIPENLSLDIVAALPRATYLAIPECGHWPWLEQPKAFYEAVEAFLARR
jgi:proline iminopeptidase